MCRFLKDRMFPVTAALLASAMNCSETSRIGQLTQALQARGIPINSEWFQKPAGLVADGSSISNAEICSVAKLKAPGTLLGMHLSDTALDDVGISCLAQREEIEFLHLSNTSVSVDGLRKLVHLPNLHTLDISNCKQLKRLSTSQILLGMPRLRMIYHYGVAISPEAFDSLRNRGVAFFPPGPSGDP